MVGERIKQRRGEMGLTQSQLGALVGMDAPAISRIERGHRKLSYEQVSRLAAALGLELYIGPPRQSGGMSATRAARDLADVFVEASNELGRLQARARDIARRYHDEATSALRSDADDIRLDTEKRLDELLNDPPERLR